MNKTDLHVAGLRSLRETLDRAAAMIASAQVLADTLGEGVAVKQALAGLAEIKAAIGPAELKLLTARPAA